MGKFLFIFYTSTFLFKVIEPDFIIKATQLFMQPAVMFILPDLGNDAVVSIATFLPFPAFARLLRTGKSVNARVKDAFQNKIKEACAATENAPSKLFERIKGMPMYNRPPLFVHALEENHSVISWSHNVNIKAFWIVTVRNFPGQPRLLLDFRISPTPGRLALVGVLQMRYTQQVVSVIMDSETAGTLLKDEGVAYADGLVEALLRERYLSTG